MQIGDKAFNLLILRKVSKILLQQNLSFLFSDFTYGARQKSYIFLCSDEDTT